MLALVLLVLLVVVAVVQVLLVLLLLLSALLVVVVVVGCPCAKVPQRNQPSQRPVHRGPVPATITAWGRPWRIGSNGRTRALISMHRSTRPPTKFWRPPPHVFWWRRPRPRLAGRHGLKGGPMYVTNEAPRQSVRPYGRVPICSSSGWRFHDAA